MANITTRETAGTGATVYGAPLPNSAIDNNFININTEVVGLTQSKHRSDTSGTVNAMTVAFSPAWTNYVGDTTLYVRPVFTNTGPVTLSVNGLAALPVHDYMGNPLVGGELKDNVSMQLFCTGTTFRILNGNTGVLNSTEYAIRPPTGTNVLVKNSSTGTLSLGTNSVVNIVLNANGSATIPTLVCTNSPTMPTPTTSDASTFGATTAFVANRIVQDRPYEATPANIKMNGTQAVGTANTVARGDHVHPTDTSRQAVLGFTPVNKAGDTMSAGALKTFATVGTVGDVTNVEQGIVVRTSGANAAHMTFVRDAIYGIKLGLDTDNVLKIGGYTMGAVSYPLIHAGNIASYGAFPAGTRMPFAQTTAPTGWTQATGDWETNRLLRVVNTNTGSVGGSHDPTYCNVVAAHSHVITVNSGNASHSHNITVNSGNAVHTHSYNTPNFTGVAAGGGSNSVWSGSYASSTTGSANAPHSHTASSDSQLAAHSHTASSDNGSSQTNWTPRYIDLIICSKN